ncbi:site-specific integrase [Brevibacillus porteri]|uniref:site-specific integrase n=1 Tax=Brevibacillus porteri TaxID=2126350 RepID=UPI003D21D583
MRKGEAAALQWTDIDLKKFTISVNKTLDFGVKNKNELFGDTKTLKKLNIPSMPILSLRHTHAVLLMETGAEMKYIQERLGHGTMQITADVYAHISLKSRKRQHEKI